MADGTAIEWTHPPGYEGATWNPTTGCDRIPGPHGSPSGCDNCYAKLLLDTRMRANPKSPRFGLPFETVLMHENRLDQPLRWKSPRCIFVNSLSDLFHDAISVDFIARVFDTMLAADQHIFQVLTKRPERMRRIVRKYYELIARGVGGDVSLIPYRNVWLGTSICSNADVWRANMLRETPAAVRFLSLEPLLGPVDALDLSHIDWVIVGGESGPNARHMRIEWVREIRDRCLALGIPFFFKQWGEWAPVFDIEPRYARVGKKLAGRELDGVVWSEYPKGLTPTERSG